MFLNKILLNVTSSRAIASLVLGASALLTMPIASAAADPAVSALNAKLDLSGGGARPGYDSPFVLSNDDDDDVEEVFRVRGAVSIPLAYSYGLQLDGAVGSFAGEAFGHGAAHVFWRDPALALVGGYASWTHWNGVDSFRTGIEGEYYAGRFALSGMVGAEFGDVDNDVYTFEDIAFYATDDLKLKIGHHYAPEVGNMFTGGFEYQLHSTPSAGYAVYADAKFGNNNFQSIFGGLKIYFGENKSLIRRHREDDPDFRDDLGSVISCVEPYDGNVRDLSQPEAEPVVPCSGYQEVIAY